MSLGRQFRASLNTVSLIMIIALTPQNGYYGMHNKDDHRQGRECEQREPSESAVPPFSLFPPDI